VRVATILGNASIRLNEEPADDPDAQALSRSYPVPKSKARKKAVYTPPQRSQQVKVSPRWLAPTMVVAWIIGILWIAIYYVAPQAPFFSDLQNWNLLIGFVFIIFGVVLSTRWR
jgi:Cell division protein CrgA